jgi:hypothetical protein
MSALPERVHRVDSILQGGHFWPRPNMSAPDVARR